MGEGKRMSLKKAIGSKIPYPFIETGRKLLAVGPRACKVCGSRVRLMNDAGYGYPVLERLQVVGGLRRRADACPVCHSSSRERLVWFWLSGAGSGFRFRPDTEIAHFAPEKGLTKVFRKAVRASSYTAYDFAPHRYRHLSGVKQADLSSLPITDQSVDLLVCNHVLEHVPDLSLALAEIHRVLKVGGTAILQVPLAMNLTESIELPLESTPDQRIETVGQDDHLRLLTPDDYQAKLTAAGFAVERYRAFDDNPDAANDWQLDPFETLHICRRIG